MPLSSVPKDACYGGLVSHTSERGRSVLEAPVSLTRHLGRVASGRARAIVLRAGLAARSSGFGSLGSREIAALTAYRLHLGWAKEDRMPRKYGKKSASKVRKAMHERKEGTLKSGRSGKTVKSRKQAIAIGLSEARRAGGKVPKKRSASSSR